MTVKKVYPMKLVQAEGVIKPKEEQIMRMEIMSNVSRIMELPPIELHHITSFCQEGYNSYLNRAYNEEGRDAAIIEFLEI